MPVSLVCVVCTADFAVIPSRAKTAKYCCYQCHQIGEGRKGGIVRGEQMKATSQGKTYTKTNGRHTHRVVMEEILGRPLNNQEIVHHKDGNKLNNSPENLELLPSQAEHVRQHVKQMLKRRKELHGY